MFVLDVDDQLDISLGAIHMSSCYVARDLEGPDVTVTSNCLEDVVTLIPGSVLDVETAFVPQNSAPFALLRFDCRSIPLWGAHHLSRSGAPVLFKMGAAYSDSWNKHTVQCCMGDREAAA